MVDKIEGMPDGQIDKRLSETRHQMEDSKILSRLEELQNELKGEMLHLQSEMRNMVASRSKQDELNQQLLSQLHQIGEMLQKLEQAHQYTHRLVSQHEKNLQDNRQLIHKIELEIRKIKSVLRVD